MQDAKSVCQGILNLRKIDAVSSFAPPHLFIQFLGLYSLIHLTINGNPRAFTEDQLSVEALVQKLELVGKRLAIERNGEIVPRSTFAATLLAEGDQLEIVGAVGGG